jgi:hypothetical protein
VTPGQPLQRPRVQNDHNTAAWFDCRASYNIVTAPESGDSHRVTVQEPKVATNKGGYVTKGSTSG